MFFSAAVSVFGQPADVSVDSPTKRHSQNSYLKAYVDPDTGEILTYEQWRELGLDTDREDAAGSSEKKEPDTRFIKSKTVTLPDGSTVTVIDAEDAPGTETKVWFDEKGEAHLSH